VGLRLWGSCKVVVGVNERIRNSIRLLRCLLCNRSLCLPCRLAIVLGKGGWLGFRVRDCVCWSLVSGGLEGGLRVKVFPSFLHSPLLNPPPSITPPKLPRTIEKKRERLIRWLMLDNKQSTSPRTSPKTSSTSSRKRKPNSRSYVVCVRMSRTPSSPPWPGSGN